MNNNLIKLAHNDDEKHLIARLNELVQKAAHGIIGLSGFLDLRLQELARAVAVNEPAIAWHLDGGYEEAERRRLLVYPDWETESDARIAYLRIIPKEYREQSIGHRDYLGAVLNLGIKRDKLGDIVAQDGLAFLIVDVDMADYICRQFTRVKHSSIEVEIVPKEQFVFRPQELQVLQLSLASLRLDAGVAAVFNLSRAQVDDLVNAGQVRINQLQVYKGAAPIKISDLISVRGWGRFRLEEIGSLSRKGRQRVQICLW